MAAALSAQRHFDGGARSAHLYRVMRDLLYLLPDWPKSRVSTSLPPTSSRPSSKKKLSRGSQKPAPQRLAGFRSLSRTSSSRSAPPARAMSRRGFRTDTIRTQRDDSSCGDSFNNVRVAP